MSRRITTLTTSLFLASMLLFTACGDEPGPPPSTAPATADPAEPVEVPKKDAKPVPRFDADSAYSYVAAQVAFGSRVVNTPGHTATKQYLIGKLKQFGAEVEEQDFNATTYYGANLEATNIIGRYNPDLPNRILLGAHWDTRHIADSKLEADSTAIVYGADDGASGVGVLLELARQLGLSTPDIGVDIVFFDAEDLGSSGDAESWGLGSQHYGKTLTEPKPKYGILLDMVGEENATFAYEEYSRTNAMPIITKVWDIAHALPYGKYFPRRNGGSVLDDHFFVMKYGGVPMIDIINHRQDTETGFVRHWHTGNDNMDKISKATLQAVGQTVTAVIYREAQGTI
ncbi:MAG: M28 family peptidase [Bacteroidota bacterium]